MEAEGVVLGTFSIGSPAAKPTLSPAWTTAVLGWDQAVEALRPQRRSRESGSVLGATMAKASSMSGTGLTSLEENEGLTYITIIVDYSHFSFSRGGWREVAYRMYSHVSVQAPPRIKRPKRSIKSSVMVGKEESSKRTHTVSAGAGHKQSSESINGRRKHLEKGRWAVEYEDYNMLNERGIHAVFILAPSSRHITIYTRRYVVFFSAYTSGHHPSHHKPLCRHSVLLPRPSS